MKNRRRNKLFKRMAAAGLAASMVLVMGCGAQQEEAADPTSVAADAESVQAADEFDPFGAYP